PVDAIKAELAALKKPNANDFKGEDAFEKYEAAKDEYYEKRSDLKTKLAKAEAREEFRLEQAQQQAAQKMDAMLKEAQEKYKDDAEAAPKIRKAATEIVKTAPDYIRSFIGDSEVIGDLLYTLSDPTTLNNLLETAKTNPGKALRVLRDMELDVQKAVTKESAKTDDGPTRGEDSKSKASDEKKETPVETKPRAPKPVSEVGGRAATTE